MSLNAHHLDRSIRRDCSCGRHAVFHQVGHAGVRYRRDHDLCPRCWRSVMNRARGEQVARGRAVRVDYLPSFLFIELDEAFRPAEEVSDPVE